ncbi:hypothetical protein FRC07_004022, partial [Ceratobasidium sp. 392]
MPGHKKSASTKESKAPKPSAQTNPTKDTSGRGKSSRHRHQSDPDPQQEQELGDEDAEHEEEDAAQTGDISMADPEPELPATALNLFGHAANKERSFAWATTSSAVPAPQFVVVGQPSQEATEIAVPKFKQVDVEGLSTERIFKMTIDEMKTLSTKGETNKSQAIEKYCALEKYCLGIAVLNFACPFGAGTFIKIKNGVVHDCYNPRDLNDAHVKNLAQVFAVPEKKTDFDSPIITQIDPQHIEASCREDMKHVRNIFGVAENPPMLRLNISEEEIRLLENLYWSQSQDEGWLTQDQMNQVNARIIDLRLDPLRVWLRLINGHHRTAAMIKVAEDILALKPGLIDMARHGTDKVAFKQQLDHFMRLVANCTYRVLILSHETPEHVLAHFAENPKAGPQLEESQPEIIWMMATRFLGQKKLVEQQSPGLPRPEVFNATRNLLIELSGDPEAAPEATGPSNPVEIGPDDAPPEESDEETGAKKKKTGSSKKSGAKKGGPKGKTSKEKPDEKNIAETKAEFKRIVNFAPLVEFAISTRACWFAWGAEMMRGYHATTMMRVQGGPLATNMWLDIETLLCLTNVSGIDKLTTCEDYLRGKLVTPLGRIDAVPHWNSVQQHPSDSPPLLDLWTKSLSTSFQKIWVLSFPLTKNKESEKPIGPWWEDDSIQKLRDVFMTFGTSDELMRGDDRHRMLGVMARLMPRLIPTPVRTPAQPIFPGAGLPFKERFVQFNRHANNIPRGESVFIAASLLNDTELHDAMRAVEKKLAKTGRGLLECVRVCSANKMVPQGFPVLERLAKETPEWRHGTVHEARKLLDIASQDIYAYLFDRSTENPRTFPDVVSHHPILDIVSPSYWSTVKAKQWADGWQDNAGDTKIGHRIVGWGLSLDMFQTTVMDFLVEEVPELEVLSAYAEDVCAMTGTEIWFKGRYDQNTLAAKQLVDPTPDPTPPPTSPAPLPTSPPPPSSPPPSSPPPSPPVDPKRADPTNPQEHTTGSKAGQGLKGDKNRGDIENTASKNPALGKPPGDPKAVKKGRVDDPQSTESKEEISVATLQAVARAARKEKRDAKKHFGPDVLPLDFDEEENLEVDDPTDVDEPVNVVYPSIQDDGNRVDTQTLDFLRGSDGLSHDITMADTTVDSQVPEEPGVQGESSEYLVAKEAPRAAQSAGCVAILGPNTAPEDLCNQYSQPGVSAATQELIEYDKVEPILVRQLVGDTLPEIFVCRPNLSTEFLHNFDGQVLQNRTAGTTSAADADSFNRLLNLTESSNACIEA